MIGSEVRWSVVLSALAGGTAAAMQIGKASATIPVLRDMFGLSISEVSLYLALFSLGAALLGLPLALATQRFGVLRSGIVGLALIAGSSLIGAMAETWPTLLVCRAVESLGLPLVVATMPTIVQSAAGPERRQIVGGVWAAWLPLGVALALFLSVPLLREVEGWRVLFLWSGVMPILAIVMLLCARPDRPAATSASVPGRITADIWLMSVAFLLFSAMNLTLTGFLPSVATSDLGLSLPHGAIYGGVAALLIVVGNVLAIFGLSRGWRPNRTLSIGFAGMGISAALFLLPVMPVSLRIAGGIGFHLCGGIVPGVIWAQIPLLVRRSGKNAPFAAGLYYQAAGVGQVVGPLLAGVAVEQVGSWIGGLAVLVPSAMLGCIIVFSYTGSVNRDP
jgi:MFS family permease